MDKRLSDIMKAIHNQCVRFGERDGFINYVDGADTAGFRKVSEAMLGSGAGLAHANNNARGGGDTLPGQYFQVTPRKGR